VVILVVEDDSTTRSVLADLLRAEGHDALAVANGREGVAVCNAVHPDVLILDYSLPDMTGLDVLEEVDQDPESCVVAIVTGHYLSPRAKRTAESLGASLFAKPVSPREFLRFVRTARPALRDAARPAYTRAP
jgi:CheY-like chemotaxis protein